jgi:hypothetical protein
MPKSSSAVEYQAESARAYAAVQAALLLGAGGLLLLAAWMAWGTSRQIANSHASVDWPTTEGTVQQSYVAHTSGAAGTARSQSAVLRYQYQVDGRAYEGRNWTLDPNGKGRQRTAQEVVDQYPVGDRVTVFYHPDRPREAVLEAGGSAAGSWTLAGGMVLVVVVLAVVSALMLRAAVRLHRWCARHQRQGSQPSARLSETAAR